ILAWFKSVNLHFALHKLVKFTPLSGSEKLVLREVFTSVQDSGPLLEYIRTYVFASVHIRLLDKELIMENGFLDKVEDNAAVQTCYGDLPYLLDIKVNKHLFRALAQFWKPAYSCFTFGGGDLVLTVEEYIALLCCSKIQADRVYSRSVNVPTFLKKLINITEMSEQWVAARIRLKGDSKFVFPKALGHVDEVVTYPFDRLDKGVTPVLAILTETFRSLNECRRVDEILYRCGNFDWVALLGI
ncbi:hypothetical protein Gotur_018799, partial [Gossypium turneri]